MLVQDLDLDRDTLKVQKKKTKKTQILLYDTQRRWDDFLTKIKYRKNGEYEDIPHYVITKLGITYQLFDTNYSSVTFRDNKIDRKFIKVALENLGWLNKNTITGFLFNWIGDPYRSEPYVRHWRDHYFWDIYTDQQMSSLSELCNFLCEKHNIPKQSVPSQALMENMEDFSGVVCKSNFSNIYTDINPSFNFRIFFKDAK